MTDRSDSFKTRAIVTVGLSLAAIAMTMVAVAKPSWKDPVDPDDQIEIDEVRTLHFGTIAPDRLSSGVVRVRPNRDNSSQCGNPLTCLEDGTRGQFRVSGGDDRFVQLSLPTEAILRNPSGSTMWVDRFKMHASGFLQGRGKMKKDGFLTISIGADLTVGAQQPSGRYEGTYELEIVYE